jgi:hypothetical protein
MKMKIALRSSVAFLALAFSTYSFALPDAVCGNGNAVGNPHCNSSSAAPIGDFASGWLGAGMLVVAGGVGLILRRRNQGFDNH